MRKGLVVLVGAEGKRCRDPRPDWRVRNLFDPQDPDYSLCWELLARKANHSARVVLRRNPWLRDYHEQEDLEQTLLLKASQVGAATTEPTEPGGQALLRYGDLDWVSYSKILTVSFPNHIRNLITRERRVPYLATVSECEEGRALLKLEAKAQHTSPSLSLTEEDLMAILTSFLQGLYGSVLSKLSGLPALHGGFESLATEVLWILESSRSHPDKSFSAMMQALGYTDRAQSIAISRAVCTCIPEYAQGLTAKDVFELTWAM